MDTEALDLIHPMRPLRTDTPTSQEEPRSSFQHIQPLVPSAIDSLESDSSSALPSKPALSSNSDANVAPRSISDEEEYLAKYGTKTASGNSRIFNCKQCNRAFTREEHLTRHTLSTHNKLKPFVCGICSRPFSRRDLLLRHANNLHQGSELAVNRIRKLYKRSKRGDDSDEDDEEDHEEGESHNLVDLVDPLFQYQNSPSSNEEKELASYTSSSLAIKPEPYTPDKKRMKMSVNMLVS